MSEPSTPDPLASAPVAAIAQIIPGIDNETLVKLAGLFASTSAASTAEAVALALAKLNRRKVTAGEYDPKSSYHPSKAKRKFLTRVCLDNGTPINEDTLFDREVELLNQITRPGRYINRRVEVVIVEAGPDNTFVDIRRRNKTPDQRNELRAVVRTLGELLEKVVDEQNKVLEEEDLWREARAGVIAKATEERRIAKAAGITRESFSSKATREAREKAGV